MITTPIMCGSEKLLQMNDSNAFHNKYRPKTLRRLIGHETAVTRLKGLVASGKVPNALGFFGPPSAGKTTMARAFAAELNGFTSKDQMRGDYTERNAAEQKTMEDVKDLVKISRFRPTEGKYRVIVVDEAQQLLTNKQAAQAILKPLEEPSPSTVWILCSMEPLKFGTTIEGKAMLTRLSQFILDPHTDEDLLKQAKRIMKGEDMAYVRPILNDIVTASGREMRTLAQVMQGVQQYYDGLENPPRRLTPDVISGVLRSVVTSDDDQALEVLLGTYSGKFDRVVKALLDVKDGFMFVQKLLWANSYLMYKAALNGSNHAELKHWAPLNRALSERTKKNPVPINILATVNVALTNLRIELGNPGISAPELIAARLYSAIVQIHGSD